MHSWRIGPWWTWLQKHHWQQLSEEEILRSNRPNPDTSHAAETSDPESPAQPLTAAEVTTTLNPLECLPDVQPVKVLQVQSLLHLAKMQQCEGLSQKKVTDFFYKKWPVVIMVMLVSKKDFHSYQMDINIEAEYFSVSNGSLYIPGKCGFCHFIFTDISLPRHQGMIKLVCVVP